MSSAADMFDKASIFRHLYYTYNDEPLTEKLGVEFNRALGYADANGPRRQGVEIRARR
jgi:hypothetical protein